MKSLSILFLTVPLLSAGAAPTSSPAVAGPWEKTVTLPAEALPYDRVQLGSTATGWVKSVSADAGSRVKAGDVLAVIQAPELEAALTARAAEAKAARQKIAGAKAVQRSAVALEDAAKSESTRISGLAKSGTVTGKARDESAARFAAASAKVGEAEAMIAGAEAEAFAAEARETEAEAALAYRRITAPFDGLVVARNAELGDFLGPASKRDSLFTMEQTDPLRLRVQIPEHAAALADAGDAMTVKIGGLEIVTTLKRVAGSLDPVTKTMMAEAEVSGLKLLPGAYGTAVLSLEKLPDAVLVPLAALRSEADGSRYVIVKSGHVERKVPAVLAAVDGSAAVLSKGPANGEAVVVP